MKVALAQINTTVGDVDGNATRVLDAIGRAQVQNVDLIVFPELCLFGYPPRDLVLRGELIDRNIQALKGVAGACRRIAAVVGYVKPSSLAVGKGLYNAAAVCVEGQVAATYAKRLLPTYDVFDEARHFDPGPEVCVVPLELVDGSIVKLGITICEDLWNHEQFDGRRLYGVDPIGETIRQGADWLINVSASPYRTGIQSQRERLFHTQFREHRVPLIYTNLVGGNDDVLFDGASLVLDADGRCVARAKAFAEDLLIHDSVRPADSLVHAYPDRLSGIRQALVMGIRDYMTKCGFREALIGLSGGIDSAVTAALAVEALGADRVHGVSLPSRFSSRHSVEDARALADRLRIGFEVISIDPGHRAFEDALRPIFGDRAPDTTEENLQARVRGTILMALSNKFGWLLLTTGNKSEWAVGFCTLYGDMCGGLAVLSDVPKTDVYLLARHLNEGSDHPVIPERTITKPPSAELRENQIDQDTLPPYEELDSILEFFVEGDESIDQMVARGFDRSTVERIVTMVERAEYKRKQAPVGLKVTSKAFGTGRRMPIAARWSFRSSPGG